MNVNVGLVDGQSSANIYKNICTLNQLIHSHVLLKDCFSCFNLMKCWKLLNWAPLFLVSKINHLLQLLGGQNSNVNVYI